MIALSYSYIKILPNGLSAKPHGVIDAAKSTTVIALRIPSEHIVHLFLRKKKNSEQ